MPLNILTGLSLENFTAFEKLEMSFSPGLNILIGENGSGKTHILKLLYAACDIARKEKSFGDKIHDVFLPFQKRIGRLAQQQKKSVSTRITVMLNGEKKLSATFSNDSKSASDMDISGRRGWCANRIDCAFIPVKEMLAHGPGFRSLYANREIQFEETYADILDLAYLPRLRGPVDEERKRLLDQIERVIDGKVVTKNEFFFLTNNGGELEFSLLAEGMRKLALLWLLVRNGALPRGAILFWDEPETNLNPRMMGRVVDILIELQRMGVQIFLATHNYVILKEFDLRGRETDAIFYHSLFREESSRKVEYHGAEDFSSIHPNDIVEAHVDLYDRDVERDFADYA